MMEFRQSRQHWSTYCKFLKYSDTQNICCNHSKFELCSSTLSPNDADRMANSVDPDQTLWVCTICPGISVRKLRIITVLWFSYHSVRRYIRKTQDFQIFKQTCQAKFECSENITFKSIFVKYLCYEKLLLTY